MQTRERPGLAEKLEEKLEFYREWFSRSKTIGAIAPSSTIVANKMASAVRPGDGRQVLELGPGNGAITRAILDRDLAPGDLISVEYCSVFLPGLRRRYPGVNFIHGDAFSITPETLGRKNQPFDTIISALPLLNFPLIRRVRFVESMLALLEPGRPLVQFSYGPLPPVRSRANRYRVDHLDTVLRNLPPARIWIYRSPVQP